MREIEDGERIENRCVRLGEAEQRSNCDWDCEGDSDWLSVDVNKGRDCCNNLELTLAGGTEVATL